MENSGNTGAFITTEAANTTAEVTPEVAKPETPAPEAPKPEADRFSSKFAALSRKEKEVKAMEKAIKAKEAEIAKKLAEYEERSKGEKSLEEQIKENPLRYLREKMGYTFEQLAEMQLNDENPTTEMKFDRRFKDLESKALSEVERLKAELAEKEKRAEQERYEAITKQFKAEIRAEVDSADTYELVQANEAYDLVFSVIEDFYKQTSEYDDSGALIKPGKILSVKEAAAEVEAHLEAEAMKIMKLKKFQKQTSKNEEPQKKTAPTLSNTLASEVPISGRRPLSKEEEIEQAAKMIKWS